MTLAVTLLMTYIGVPCIYYGDGWGCRGATTRIVVAASRGTVQWDHHNDLYRRLIQLRKQRPALRRGDMQTLYAGDHTLAFARSLESDLVLVACSATQAILATSLCPSGRPATAPSVSVMP